MRRKFKGSKNLVNNVKNEGVSELDLKLNSLIQWDKELQKRFENLVLQFRSYTLYKEIRKKFGGFQRKSLSSPGNNFNAGEVAGGRATHFEWKYFFKNINKKDIKKGLSTKLRVGSESGLKGKDLLGLVKSKDTREIGVQAVEEPVKNKPTVHRDIQTDSVVWFFEDSDSTPSIESFKDAELKSEFSWEEYVRASLEILLQKNKIDEPYWQSSQNSNGEISISYFDSAPINDRTSEKNISLDFDKFLNLFNIDLNSYESLEEVMKNPSESKNKIDGGILKYTMETKEENEENEVKENFKSIEETWREKVLWSNREKKRKKAADRRRTEVYDEADKGSDKKQLNKTMEGSKAGVTKPQRHYLANLKHLVKMNKKKSRVSCFEINLEEGKEGSVKLNGDNVYGVVQNICEKLSGKISGNLMNAVKWLKVEKDDKAGGTAASEVAEPGAAKSDIKENESPPKEEEGEKGTRKEEFEKESRSVRTKEKNRKKTIKKWLKREKLKKRLKRKVKIFDRWRALSWEPVETDATSDAVRAAGEGHRNLDPPAKEGGDHSKEVGDTVLSEGKGEEKINIEDSVNSKELKNFSSGIIRIKSSQNDEEPLEIIRLSRGLLKEDKMESPHCSLNPLPLLVSYSNQMWKGAIRVGVLTPKGGCRVTDLRWDPFEPDRTPQSLYDTVWTLQLSPTPVPVTSRPTDVVSEEFSIAENVSKSTGDCDKIFCIYCQYEREKKNNLRPLLLDRKKKLGPTNSRSTVSVESSQLHSCLSLDSVESSTQVIPQTFCSLSTSWDDGCGCSSCSSRSFTTCSSGSETPPVLGSNSSSLQNSSFLLLRNALSRNSFSESKIEC